MRLYNAIYAIWLLSGNIMTDQTVSVNNSFVRGWR